MLQVCEYDYSGGELENMHNKRQMRLNQWRTRDSDDGGKQSTLANV